MARCLFTDEDLTPLPAVEHTIPRGVGGRIESREVSSTAFNGRCSQVLDRFLNELYADVMSVLGPVLPGASRAGLRFVELPGHDGRYAIDGHGRLTMRGARPVAFDPVTGRPTAVVGADEASMRRIIDQNIQPGATERRREELPPSQNVVFPRRATLCAEIELAALKATMLSFDHLLRNAPDRFTRLPAVAPVRETIRGMVMDTTPVDPAFMTGKVLGLQYEAEFLDRYRILRQQVPFPETPFEHVLFASGNRATGTLDLVFWVFRTDPYAFRICDDWHGESFTSVIVNGIVANSGFSDVVSLSGGVMLGEPNMRRSHIVVRGAHPTDDERQAIHGELFARRQELYRQAVDYIERHTDDFVAESLARYARANGTADHRVVTGIRLQLAALFDDRLDDASLAEFDGIVGGVLAGAPGDVCVPAGQGGPANLVDVPAWLARYRGCLDALHDRFGLPGAYYLVNDAEVMPDPRVRVLGRPPEAD